MARWHAGRGDRSRYSGGADWLRAVGDGGAGSIANRPQILAGAGGDVVRYLAEVPEFGETEPLLLAAVASALPAGRRRVGDSSSRGGASSGAAHRSARVAQYHAPETGRVVSAPRRGHQSRRSVWADGPEEWPGGGRTRTGPELQPLIDYYVAGCEWSMGRLDTAMSRLQIAAGNLERRQGLDGASVEPWSARTVRGGWPGSMHSAGTSGDRCGMQPPC